VSGPAVVAAVTTAEVAGTGDLRAAARASGASRPVMRFLDGMALPAFVAGVAALDAAGVTDGERCGVFTVSGWDPDQHQPDIGPEAPSVTTVARHYITTASPTAWLRKMVNNTLCQLSLTRNLRGPNNHVVGGPEALAVALVMADRAVAGGAADHILVVAFDAPAGHESDHEVDGEAAAVVVGRPGPGSPPRPAVTDLVGPATGPAGGAPHVRAVDALDALAGGATLVAAGPERGPHDG
jgi:hypothetical protein